MAAVAVKAWLFFQLPYRWPYAYIADAVQLIFIHNHPGRVNPVGRQHLMMQVDIGGRESHPGGQGIAADDRTKYAYPAGKQALCLGEMPHADELAYIGAAYWARAAAFDLDCP